MIGIYKITNLINNKIYIGQSKNIEKRWARHRTGPFNLNNNCYDSPLYRAIRKYGLNNFSFEVIEQCNNTDLNKKEIYWIHFYDSNNNDKGYNLTDGGESAITASKLNWEQVHEIKKLLSESYKSQQEIADIYGVSQRTISGINSGQSWLEDGYIYPLRKIHIPINRNNNKNKNNNKIENNNEIKNNNTCIDCGTVISPGAKRCLHCAGKFNRKVERPTREELKLLIRTTPFTTIGKNFNVSDNAIRKWCKTYNLPSKARDIKKYSDEEWNII